VSTDAVPAHATGRPRLVVVAGPPCSGKSTVSRLLAATLGMPHLEMDRFRQRLMPGAGQQVEQRDLAYRAMHLTAELMAPWCGTVVLDATYAAQICRTELIRAIERLGATLVVVECHVDVATAVARYEARREHTAVDLTVERVALLAASYPYSDQVCAVGGAAGRPMATLHAADVLRRILNADAGALWSRHGTPFRAVPHAVADSSALV
jgi:predicted kinase